MTKGYGLTVDYINQSCPADLEPYANAYNMEQKHNDSLAWMYCGNYVFSAVKAAVEQVLAGRKAKSKYIEKPIMSDIKEQSKENAPLTEEKKKKQTEQLFLKLRIMEANFNNNHKGNKGS